MNFIMTFRWKLIETILCPVYTCKAFGIGFFIYMNDNTLNVVLPNGRYAQLTNDPEKFMSEMANYIEKFGKIG